MKCSTVFIDPNAGRDHTVWKCLKEEAQMLRLVCEKSMPSYTNEVIMSSVFKSLNAIDITLSISEKGQNEIHSPIYTCYSCVVPRQFGDATQLARHYRARHNKSVFDTWSMCTPTLSTGEVLKCEICSLVLSDQIQLTAHSTECLKELMLVDKLLSRQENIDSLMVKSSDSCCDSDCESGDYGDNPSGDDLSVDKQGAKGWCSDNTPSYDPCDY
jgi:hypothetical protein